MFRNAGVGPISTSSNSGRRRWSRRPRGCRAMSAPGPSVSRWPGGSGRRARPSRDDHDPVSDHRDGDVAQQRGADVPHLVRRRLVRRDLDQAVHDRVAGDSADQEQRHSNQHEAPAGRSQRPPAPSACEVHRQREQQDPQRRQHDRQALDSIGDVLRGLQLVRAHDHQLAAGGRQRDPELLPGPPPGPSHRSNPAASTGPPRPGSRGRPSRRAG